MESGSDRVGDLPKVTQPARGFPGMCTLFLDPVSISSQHPSLSQHISLGRISEFFRPL